MKNYVTIQKWDQQRDPITQQPYGDWQPVGDVTVRAADIAEVYTLDSLGMTQLAVIGGGFHKQVVTKDSHFDVLGKIAEAMKDAASKK